MVRQNSKARLEIRAATPDDVPGIVALVKRCYKDLPTYTPGEVRGQINNYPEGCFVAVLDDQYVGYCASMRIAGALAMTQHSWREITGAGYGSRHDPNGEWLYGYEMCVDPEVRGSRIGRRIYAERRSLVERLDLSGIIFAGRMPNYAKYRKKFADPRAYLAAVAAGEIHDPVIRFQLANGFEAVDVMEDYLPSDAKSLGNAALMVWRNPYVDHDQPKKFRVPRGVESVRIATCQLQARAVANFEEFISNIEYFVDVAAGYQSDFVVFPELFTLQLLSYEPQELSPVDAIARLTTYTPEIRKALADMAMRYNINIIGGSHPTLADDGDVQNVSYICLRNGAVHEQEKIHPTPNERYWWNIKGGDSIDAIQTDCGPIGVLICYDSEFPELARRLVDQGARIIFTPFCTDSRQGYLRVRYCCQARAIENQCFVVMSGNVGNLPNVHNMDVQYAQSCILTPCDFPFARDGIAAEATENVETMTISEVNLADLSWARAEGTVRNLADRRFDLYNVNWNRHPVQHRRELAIAPTSAGKHGPGGG
ncbi:nitrilase-related carbon-nitrogen hydrolase [Sphingomonas xanthus]|uniref:Carbon-nitrogen hydrolase n=1 Tax=Sphingomonas xanthus TaxID=2594473 RepID=A0A516INY9_9SPHN|nr:nitrilase-related carbon-nitrogen hydrolase [Sphingomonas xanthus]QDP18632.1 carbon-nitrogen hydrolase [Sphingomonas xanthus]